MIIYNMTQKNNPNSLIFIISVFSLSLIITPILCSPQNKYSINFNQMFKVVPHKIKYVNGSIGLDNIIKVPPYIIDYGKGSIVVDTTFAPTYSPPLNNPQFQSKDITIGSAQGKNLKARVFIPARPDPTHKIPILLYFHGGAFCIGSAFTLEDTTYLGRVSAEAKVVVVSIEYHLFPNYTIPVPYEDAGAALKWIAAHKKSKGAGLDPWVAQYGDLGRVFVGGESAGANIAHNLMIDKKFSGSVRVKGLFLAMPYFLGSKRVMLEPDNIVNSSNYKIWSYVCPKCKDGVDDKYINPFGPKPVNLARLGCEKLLVYTSEVDELRGRGRLYYERVKASGWKGQAKLVEAPGQDHVFHIFKPLDPQTTKFIRDLSAFLNS